MKNTAMFWVGVTTLVLFTVTLTVALDFPFHWIFYLTLIGQILLVYMVYKVLTDNYTTDKTFADFYEDNPMPRSD